jgi:hypothetical protein
MPLRGTERWRIHLALYEGKYSVSSSHRFCLRRIISTYWLGGWVGSTSHSGIGGEYKILIAIVGNEPRLSTLYLIIC